MKFVLYCLTFSLISLTHSFARVHDFETTRLKSTAGAGVGSILMNEAAILNPAPISFFKNSAFYFQRETYDFSGGPASQEDQNSQWSDSSKNMGFIVADTKTNLNGAVSYQKQEERDDTRERFSSSLSSPIGQQSALGFMYRKTTDKNATATGEKVKEEYHQLVVGVTHVISENLTLGAIVVDPFKAMPEDTRAIIGSQFLYKNIVALMLDVGGDYTGDLAEKRLYRVASQISFLDSLYLRFGVFEDKGLNEKGNGVGIAWVGPKLVIEAAMKNTKPLDPAIDNGAEKIRETSLALSYHF